MSRRASHLAWLGAAILCASGPVALGDSSSGFDLANKLYEQGKYSEAASAYDALAHGGSASVAVYYNQGNAFYKAGQVGRAVASYRQAERINPRDPDVQANLQFIRNRIQGPTLQQPRWEHWLGTLTLNEWAMLAMTSLWLALLSLTAVQIRRDWKRALRFPSIVFAIATVGFSLCLAGGLIVRTRPTAIVTAGDAVVRNGPLEDSQPSFTAHDGAELSVLDRKDNWLQVAADGRIGWIKEDQVLF